ncbi:anti-sigma-28 factor, FlgM family [Caldanaerobius fijiensis DSM 17918]|uniref:Negative regulator of flagellin synthesis n=1 Tax=Caldanaerobius fijiensis DSM 17918 TaxID=1121256 RepID=A0A1M4UX12_9THEO|nr:flagellar biosynthesis anti-sigma factor FlgM [Caldanaerobius fijiensis]SHE61254.1 anti-sigma-28 factor, FlgM family [Caldanaerobius fijiensis DSM 17918]
MRIENYSTQRVLASYNAQVKKDKAIARNAEEQKDSIIISEEGQLIHKAVARMKELPDVRCDVVEKLKQSINAGKYVIDAKQIAGNIIDRKA